MKTSEIKYHISKSLTRSNYWKTKKFLSNSNAWDIDRIQAYQNKKLREIIEYCYQNIPYYRTLLTDLGLSRFDFVSTKDLTKLPILTKEIITQHRESFFPVNKKIKFRECSTGGSTGVPLKYRLSDDSALFASLLLDRGLGMGGYRPGDKMATIAGGSLTGSDKSLKKYCIERLTNLRFFSSYGMDDELLMRYAKNLIDYQPKYLRGYASALIAVANYMASNNLSQKIKIKSVFSTSETLTDNARRNIEKIFNCDVYDTWGLNDGGASAFECREHKGMHIDTERAIVECIPRDEQSDSQEFGRVVVTSLIEQSMPLIRYDTGDLGRLENRKCACGCNRPRLFLGAGRATDYLKINGKIIGAPVLTVLMGKIPVKQYQIAKTSSKSLVVRIVKDKDYSNIEEDFIIKSLKEKLGQIEIIIEHREIIIPPGSGKHKFIIDEST